MRQFGQNREVFDTDTLEPVSEFIGVGNRVLVRLIWRGVGHGPESVLEWTTISTVRKGSVINIEYFWDHAEALKAVGLEEFLDLGSGVTLAVVLQRARLVGSSAFVELRYGAVITWVDGLAQRWAVYGGDIDDARAAAERLAQERG